MGARGVAHSRPYILSALRTKNGPSLGAKKSHLKDKKIAVASGNANSLLLARAPSCDNVNPTQRMEVIFYKCQQPAFKLLLLASNVNMTVLLKATWYRPALEIQHLFLVCH